jgi:hypothetical protein
MFMKRILIGALIVIFAFAGVAMAAETAVPTLTDVLTAIQELKADVAQLKADGFTKSNTAGILATAKSTDSLVILEVTSLMAGPDATVVGVKVTNKSTDQMPMFSGEISTTLTAGGAELKIKLAQGTGNILPGTSKQFILLADPLPKDVKEVVMRTKVIDSKTYKTTMEPMVIISTK